MANLAPLQDRLWSDAAIENELTVLGSLPDESINRPGSTFSVALLKLASVVKGTGADHISPITLLEEIKYACRVYPWMSGKEIDRQWKRAMKKAHPRYRIESDNVASNRGAGFASVSYRIGRYRVVAHDHSYVIDTDLPGLIYIKSLDLNRGVYKWSRRLGPGPYELACRLSLDVVLFTVAHYEFGAVGLESDAVKMTVVRGEPGSLIVDLSFDFYSLWISDVMTAFELVASAVVLTTRRKGSRFIYTLRVAVCTPLH